VYRPQFALSAPPPGFVWQPCLYEFSQVNVPALGTLLLAAGAETGRIPLPLDKDACFTLLAVKIQNGGVNLLLEDPWDNKLMDDFVKPALYASEVMTTPLESGIEVPAGAVFSVRLQG
jgi:hypothetical protein